VPLVDGSGCARRVASRRWQLDRPPGIPDGIHTGGRAAGEKGKLVRGKGAWTLPRARRRAASENKALPANGAQSSSLLSAILSWNCAPS
jgi:hypothetical protein